MEELDGVNKREKAPPTQTDVESYCQDAVKN